MFPRTAIAVTTGSDFVVEGAVDFVLFGTENGGEIVGHDRGLSFFCLVWLYMVFSRKYIVCCSVKW